MARISGWPEEDQQELLQYAREIEAGHEGPYRATPAELQVLDEAVAAVRRGEVATDEEVVAVFANTDADEGRILARRSRGSG
jgi:hypothetical protein